MSTYKPFVELGPGSLGVIRSLPSHRLPPDGLYDCANVLFRDGKLQNRPGYTLHPNDFEPPVLTSTPLGFLSFRETSGTLATLLGTDRDVWKYDPRSSPFWQASYTGLSGSLDTPTRFTGIERAGEVEIYVVNGQDTLLQGTNGQVFAPVSVEGITAFTDITTVGDRIVGIEPPFTVRWSELFGDGWPTLNVRRLSDTLGSLVALSPLGVLGMVLYKEDSVWLAFAQGGPSSQAFGFQLHSFHEGPANPNALVNAQGLHFYMTPHGRIARFDGSTHTWIADAAWPAIRADLDMSYSQRIHGVYEPLYHEVYFFYPRQGGNGHITGLVMVALPLPESGRNTVGTFLGNLSHSVTASGKRFPDSQTSSVLLGCNEPQTVFLFTGEHDYLTPFSGFWQGGFFLNPKQGHIEIEPFVETGETYGEVTFHVATSDTLDLPGGTISEGTRQLLYAPGVADRSLGFPSGKHRFIALRGTFTSPITLRYLGSLVRGLT